MSNNTVSDLYIKDILIACSPEDGNKPELDGLKLTIIDKLHRDLSLTKISRTTWKLNDNIEIPVLAQGLMLVASSESFGDLGYIHIDLIGWSARISRPDSTRTGKKLKWNLEPLEDAPGLSLSFEVYNPRSDKAENKPQEAPVEDIDPSRLYGNLQLADDGHPMKADALNFCGDEFLRNFKITQHKDDIEAAIKAYEQAVNLLSANDPRFADFIDDLGSGWHERYNAFGQVADIDEAISKLQVAVAMTPNGHEYAPRRLSNLGIFFLLRSERNEDLGDISESIRLQQHAVRLTPDRHVDLPDWLNRLGNTFLCRFDYTADLVDISEAIRLQQRAVRLIPDGHPNLPAMLNNLGGSLLRHFEWTGELADISESILIQQRVIKLTPNDHEDLSQRLSNLGQLFRRRFERSGNLTDISEAIEFHQRAVQLTPDEHANLPGLLSNLGSSFSCRFGRTGELTDISESIQLQQRGIQLAPDRHTDLPGWLNNLGISLFNRFEQAGEMADISESIRVHQRAIELTPDGHRLLSSRLNNLGNSFLSRFERTGDLGDILESIQTYQRAVQLTPDGHADLPSRLNNLAGSFLRRFVRTGELADISESIQLQRHAVQLTPDEHADLPTWLSNLGTSLLCRFHRMGELTDISESIQLQQRAVQLTPDGDANFPTRLDNLGNSLLSRYEQTGDLADISESIRLQQRAIQLTPDGHADLPAWLNSLGGALLRRFEDTEDMGDISGSIELRQRAVQLTPDGHANLPLWLTNLGNSFYRHFTHTQQHEALISALSTFRRSALSSTGSPSTRMTAAERWASLSKSFPHSELLDANERIVHLLSLVTGLDTTLKYRYDRLVDTSRLSTAAAAAALSVNCAAKALEWLEQGRCIVWNQINQLRTPIDDLRIYNIALADQFCVLSQQLEQAGSRPDPRHTGVELSMAAKISLQSEAHNHLRLVKERDQHLANIRNIPGFENFLRPRNCLDVMNRLPGNGLVIIINADKDRCDALALMVGCDEPMHIPLDRFSYGRATTLAEGLRKYLSSHQLRSRYSEEAAFNPRALVPSKPGSSDSLRVLLQTLWTDLVNPILQALAFKVPDDRGDLPRVWWCPTGPFAFLPIHAAGIYKDGKDTPLGTCLADFAISSYIPTISILERLRSRPNANVTNSGVLLVSQPDAPGLPMIPCTVAEVQKTREELTKRGIRSALYQSKDATVDVISKSLESFSCVHLACHASQGIKDPLESAIHLYDGPLKLSEIMKKNLLHADLAFMSACQTSAGDEKLPEEAVHLAAGMLAAGYRSVVATMWSISDQHAPQVAQTFYENLLNNSTNEGRAELDGTGAAEALHIAMRRLREKLGDSTEGLLAWIPYVHYGL